MIRFHVGNNWTEIEGADQSAIRLFDFKTSYPTEIAIAKMKGYDLPYEASNNWDGWIRFLRQPRTKLPWLPSGLLSRLVSTCREFRLEFEINDLRVRPEESPPDFPALELRPYQAKAVKIALARGCGVLDMPPRSGKTRTMLEVVRTLALPTLWIAPTDRICAQTIQVIKGFFGSEYGARLIGLRSEQEFRHYRVVVTTAAMAALLPQEFYDTREALVVDEYHHAAAKTYRNDIYPKCDHIYYRYGMTGTFFRSGNDEIALHAYLSDTIYKCTSKMLLDEGFLVPTQVLFLPVVCAKLRGLPTSTYQGGHGKYGIQEHTKRNQLVTWASVLLAQAGKRVLVLVGTKKQGNLLVRGIKPLIRPQASGAQFEPVEFISTNMPRWRQQKIIDAFLETDEVKILIGTSILGEGVDLPAADALVYARGERAEVSLTQNAYRVSTAMHGKTSALIVDFADRHHKKLLAHSQERLAVYFREPTFRVAVLPEVRDFLDWVGKI